MESLSVIIPVYNCKDYLESCVRSIAAVNACCDGMFVKEIILVDDGSTDGTSELCDRLALIYDAGSSVIRVIHQTNKGVSVARNAGLREAKGSFLLFVDSDDTVEPKRLANLMHAVAQDGSIDMAVYGISFDYYSGNRAYRQDIVLPPSEGIKTYNECRGILYSLYRSNVLSALWNKLIRRSVIERTGICLQEDMFLYEDLEFSLRVLAQCRKVCFFTEPVYHYRQPPDEGNAGRRLKRVAHIPEIIDKIEEALIPLGGSEDILLSLHLVLAREKINCATRAETDGVCNDFLSWVDKHQLIERIKSSEYAMLLYRKQSGKLLRRRNRSRIRHRLANAVKKTIGDFRKW